LIVYSDVIDYDYFGLILMVYRNDFREIKESKMAAFWTT